MLFLASFFTPALADCLSLVFVWLQVSSCLKNSSQYSGRFLPSVIRIVSNLPLISNSPSPFGDHSKHTSYNWHHRHPHGPQLSCSSRKDLSPLTLSLICTVVCWNGKLSLWQVLFLLLSQVLVFWQELSELFYLKSQWFLYTHSLGHILVCSFSIWKNGEILFLAHFPEDHLHQPIMSSFLYLCASLLNSIVMWLMVLSVSPYNLLLLCWYILPITALI